MKIIVKENDNRNTEIILKSIKLFPKFFQLIEKSNHEYIAYK